MCLGDSDFILKFNFVTIPVLYVHQVSFDRCIYVYVHVCVYMNVCVYIPPLSNSLSLTILCTSFYNLYRWGVKRFLDSLFSLAPSLVRSDSEVSSDNRPSDDLPRGPDTVPVRKDEKGWFHLLPSMKN